MVTKQVWVKSTLSVAGPVEGLQVMGRLVPGPMTNARALLSPTVTLTVCGVVRQELGITAWSWVLLIKVVFTVQLLPKLRRAPELKPDPKMVSVKGPELMVALVGEIAVSDELPPVTVTYRVPEVPLVGSYTKMGKVPGVTRVAGIVAMSSVEFTYWV